MSADVVPGRGHRASKLSVVGAGSVGTSLAYAALIRGSADLISLYDINDKLVEAQVRDLSHGTQFTPSLITGGSDLDVTNGSDVVVVTAGARQLPGQTRLELAAANTRLLEKIMPDLLAHSPHALFVLVTNPCDVLTVVARHVTGLPSGRVLSSGTMLDTSRLRYLIAQQINVSQRNVHATIMGEHGDSEFPAWSNASINQVPIRDWMIDGKRVFTDDVLAGLARSAVNAAYAVIEGKGATNYAIGLAGARLVEALLSPTRTVLPVSSVLDDYYGISGIALSVPTLIGARGVEEVLQIPLQPNEVEALHSSADALREALSDVGY